MFLVDYLITEAGFDDYGMGQQDQPEGGEEEQVAKIEHEDIKKFILYEQLKQIHHHLNKIQFDQVDGEFYSLLNFCQIIIEFFNNFEYPEAVHLVDNLIDGIEEKLGIKLPPRIPQESPEDEFKDREDAESQPDPNMMQGAPPPGQPPPSQPGPQGQPNKPPIPGQ